MTDAKTIVSWLEGLAEPDWRMYHSDSEVQTIAKETLAMLKKHEATMVIESENMYTGLPITHCPTCGKSLDRYLYGRQHEGEVNFCPYCGQTLKWE